MKRLVKMMMVYRKISFDYSKRGMFEPVFISFGRLNFLNDPLTKRVKKCMQYFGKGHYFPK